LAIPLDGLPRKASSISPLSCASPKRVHQSDAGHSFAATLASAKDSPVLSVAASTGVARVGETPSRLAQAPSVSARDSESNVRAMSMRMGDDLRR
jgi:hypothetical protein